MEDGDVMEYYNGMQVVILPSGFFKHTQLEHHHFLIRKSSCLSSVNGPHTNIARVYHLVICCITMENNPFILWM